MRSQYDDWLDELSAGLKDWPLPDEWVRVRTAPGFMCCPRCSDGVVMLGVAGVKVIVGRVTTMLVGRCRACNTVLWNVRVGGDAPMPASASSARPEDVVLTFGKYKGMTLGEVADKDLGYLDWLRDAHLVRRDSALEAAVGALCRKLAAQIESVIEDD